MDAIQAISTKLAEFAAHPQKQIADRLQQFEENRGRKLADDAAQKLKGMAGRFVGTVFFGTLIRQMNDSSLKGEYMHGGRGEEVFQGQLGLELAERIGERLGKNDPLTKGLLEGLQRRAGLVRNELGTERGE